MPNNPCYTMFLYSANGSGTDTRSKQFFIDWANILPKEHKRFAVTCLLRTFENANHTLDYIQIQADTLNARVWDSTKKGLGQIIGEASQFTGNVNPIYQTASNSVKEILIDYPTQPLLTITLKQIDGSSLPSAGGEWYLFMSFQPVD